jgi:predicted ATPase
MGDVEYTFKHALTLEVGYNSVLVERRRLLHERAGQAIEALFSDRLEDHLSELAHHYDRSGNARKAVEYLGRAGRLAAQQTAHSEAAGYFKRALGPREAGECPLKLPESRWPGPGGGYQPKQTEPAMRLVGRAAPWRP